MDQYIGLDVSLKETAISVSNSHCGVAGGIGRGIPSEGGS